MSEHASQKIASRADMKKALAREKWVTQEALDKLMNSPLMASQEDWDNHISKKGNKEIKEEYENLEKEYQAASKNQKRTEKVDLKQSETVENYSDWYGNIKEIYWQCSREHRANFLTKMNNKLEPKGYPRIKSFNNINKEDFTRLKVLAEVMGIQESQEFFDINDYTWRNNETINSDEKDESLDKTAVENQLIGLARNLSDFQNLTPNSSNQVLKWALEDAAKVGLNENNNEHVKIIKSYLNDSHIHGENIMSDNQNYSNPLKHVQKTIEEKSATVDKKPQGNLEEYTEKMGDYVNITNSSADTMLEVNKNIQQELAHKLIVLVNSLERSPQDRTEKQLKNVKDFLNKIDETGFSSSLKGKLTLAKSKVSRWLYQ